MTLINAEIAFMISPMSHKMEYKSLSNTFEITNFLNFNEMYIFFNIQVIDTPRGSVNLNFYNKQTS